MYAIAMRESWNVNEKSDRVKRILGDVLLYGIFFTLPAFYIWSSTWVATRLDASYYQLICGWWNVALMGFVWTAPYRSIHGRAVKIAMTVTKRASRCTQWFMTRWMQNGQMSVCFWFVFGLALVGVETALIYTRLVVSDEAWLIMTSVGSATLMATFLILMWWIGWVIQKRRPIVHSPFGNDGRICRLHTHGVVSCTECNTNTTTTTLTNVTKSNMKTTTTKTIEGQPFVALRVDMNDQNTPMVSVDVEKTLHNMNATLVVTSNGTTSKELKQPQMTPDLLVDAIRKEQEQKEKERENGAWQPFDSEPHTPSTFVNGADAGAAAVGAGSDGTGGVVDDGSVKVDIQYDLSNHRSYTGGIVLGLLSAMGLFLGLPWLYWFNSFTDVWVWILYFILMAAFVIMWLGLTYYPPQSLYSVGALQVFTWSCVLVTTGLGPWFTMTFRYYYSNNNDEANASSSSSSSVIWNITLFGLYLSFLLISRVSYWALHVALQRSSGPYLHHRFLYLHQSWSYACQFAIFGFPLEPMTWQFGMLMLISLVHQLCLVGHVYQWFWQSCLLICCQRDPDVHASTTPRTPTTSTTTTLVTVLPDACSAAQLFESILKTLSETQIYLNDTIAAFQSFVTLTLLLIWFRANNLNSDLTNRFIVENLNLASVVCAQLVIRVLIWGICFQVLRRRLRQIMSPPYIKAWFTINQQTGIYCLLDEYLICKLHLTRGSARFVLLKQCYIDDHPHLFQQVTGSPDASDFLLYWYQWFPAMIRTHFVYLMAASCLTYSFLFLNHISCPVRYYALGLLHQSPHPCGGGQF